MSNGLASVEPNGPLYRLGRRPDPWTWPDWSYAGPHGTFGNRYSDPEASYRVLYASSQRIGAFLETRARFCPDLAVLAELDLIEGETEPPPALQRSWLETACSAKRPSREDASSTSGVLMASTQVDAVSRGGVRRAS